MCFEVHVRAEIVGPLCVLRLGVSVSVAVTVKVRAAAPVGLKMYLKMAWRSSEGMLRSL